MIKFIEKKPYKDESPYAGNCTMYPTYMVLENGEEHFMYNRRVPDDSWVLTLEEERKKQLVQNGGKYFKFHGLYDNPIEMLQEIAKRQHHFTDEKESDLYYGDAQKDYLDFLGNLCETSAAFHYRIYDKELMKKVKKYVTAIREEKYELVV